MEIWIDGVFEIKTLRPPVNDQICMKILSVKRFHQTIAQTIKPKIEQICQTCP